MPPRSLIERVLLQDDVNFVITNRIPRRLATRFIGWFSAIEQPLIRDVSIGLWKLFAGDPQLHEARKERFVSLHDCFTRELKPGARPIHPGRGILVSPCDGIVGACGAIEEGRLIQAKGSAYQLDELLTDRALADPYRTGTFATLRLTASMYHRFHAPDAGHVEDIRHISGETWNVNPPALKRVPRLFCRNERVVLPIRLRESAESIVLVAVGAILVASVRLTFAGVTLDQQRRGPARIPCRASLERGQEMGYFQHGSTIIVLATRGLLLHERVREGLRIRMGEPLLRHVLDRPPGEAGESAHTAGLPCHMRME